MTARATAPESGQSSDMSESLASRSGCRQPRTGRGPTVAMPHPGLTALTGPVQFDQRAEPQVRQLVGGRQRLVVHHRQPGGVEAASGVLCYTSLTGYHDTARLTVVHNEALPTADQLPDLWLGALIELDRAA